MPCCVPAPSRRAENVRAVRASPPARIPSVVYALRECGAESGRRKCACACDEIDGSVDEDRTPTTTTTLPLPHADEQQEEAEEAVDAIAPRPPRLIIAADHHSLRRRLIRRPTRPTDRPTVASWRRRRNRSVSERLRLIRADGIDDGMTDCRSRRTACLRRLSG